MKICVIGTGYVGLVAGACFADKGYEVTCIDIDEQKINMLNAGKMPIYEPGLKSMVKRARKRNHLLFSTNLEEAVVKALAVFICVGTPEGPDGKPVMKYVYAVANSLAEIYSKHPIPDGEIRVVATKSTVPVGTGTEIETILGQKNIKNVAVASNPEFLKEGDAINDFVKPDRIIIGANTQEARDLLTDLYGPFLRRSERLLCMDRASAEMTKFAANSMLALRITFMNQIARLCEKVGADVTSVRHGIGSDSRIGSSFLFPGPGYGGSCFPKDVKALIELAKGNSTSISIMEAVDTFNQDQKHLLSEKVIEYFKDVSDKTIGIWGLTFKPETDDVRESPSIYILQDLIEKGATIKAYDPEGTDNFRKVLDHTNITYCSSMYDAAKGCDAVVIVTDWNEFKMPEFGKMKEVMAQPIIFDGRNLYSPKKLKEEGFFYSSIGRASS